MKNNRQKNIATLPTEEEATRIHHGDRELINRYYVANYNFILVVLAGTAIRGNWAIDCLRT